MEEKIDIELVDCKAAELKKMKRLEQMWPEVQKIIIQGVKNRVIHAKLNEMGLAISMGTYKNMLHRIRAKKKIVRS
jgi:hypothetical protein